MANTLSKFGVPLGGGDGRGGQLQPKYKYRFRVRVVNFGPIAGGLEISQQVQSVTKPSISHEPIQVDAYNSRAHYAGKHTWEPISLVLKDDMTNQVSRLVGHQLQKQLNHYEQTGFASGTNYKFTTYIETMDGGNDTVVEQWVLEGCFIENAQFSELDYSDSSFQTTTLSIRYDNATMSDGLMTTVPEMINGINIG